LCVKKHLREYLQKNHSGENLDDAAGFSRAFGILSLEEKKMCLWLELEFIAPAHLMTEEHVQRSLTCLDVAGVDDEQVQRIREAK
jgi:hypothetical protein